ncbi:hypothetical protein MCUN1_000754 [Malassezia cuniculi]|uniref:Uncharacterized protein n=1 Tax=Malassezia cuniculi TaxID=948313 RepID=A0AAF0J574_9BASI|nr:hypothetical protein MCUN1_000754 [Malassezia cuniculi]
MRNRKGSNKSRRGNKNKNRTPRLVNGTKQATNASASPPETVFSAADGIMSSPGKRGYSEAANSSPEHSPSCAVSPQKSSAEELLELLVEQHANADTQSIASDAQSRHVCFQEPVVSHEVRKMRSYMRHALKISRNPGVNDGQQAFTHMLDQAMMINARLRSPLETDGDFYAAQLHDDTVNTLVVASTSGSTSGSWYAPIRVSFSLTFELHSRLLLPAVSNSPDMHTRMYTTALEAFENLARLRGSGGVAAFLLWLVPEKAYSFASRQLRREESAALDKWYGSYAIPFRSTLAPHAPLRRHWHTLKYNIALPRMRLLEEQLIVALEHTIIYTHIVLSIVTALVLALLP